MPKDYIYRVRLLDRTYRYYRSFASAVTGALYEPGARAVERRTLDDEWRVIADGRGEFEADALALGLATEQELEELE